MRSLLTSAALAAAVLTATPAGATPVERCPYPEAGRVVVAGDHTVSLCASAHPCPGWIGVRVTVNGEVVHDECGPWHIETIDCPLLAILFPPEGDVTVDGYPVHDCPPYN